MKCWVGDIGEVTWGDTIFYVGQREWHHLKSAVDAILCMVLTIFNERPYLTFKALFRDDLNLV